MTSEVATLREWIAQADHIVFFGGAGVSTESGIPDFRSVDGLYHQTYAWPPETILSHTFFMRQTGDFFRFYRDKMLRTDAKPNAAHRALAALEQAGKLRAVITQNIDGLHQAAGSKNVLELHGSVHRNFCMRCHRSFSVADILAHADVPVCACGGIIKPDVVLYEESLSSEVLRASTDAIAQAEVLIVGGTSLAVYPAAGLIDHYRGHKLVLINKGETPADRRANLILRAPIAQVLAQL